MNSAFLSSLGAMGRRHLRGLVSAGYSVTAFDPSEESATLARQELEHSGFSADKLNWSQTFPTGEYDVAVFSETTENRFNNVERFLGSSTAKQFLLEKPLSADPDQVLAYIGLFEDHNISLDTVSVNFARRSWEYINRIKAECDESDCITMTVNGGAVGLGCNGIHQIDVFLYLAGTNDVSVKYAVLSKNMVESGRGAQFKDFGGTFLLESEGNMFFASLEADSNASPVITIRGNNFIAYVDEYDRSWRLMKRSAESVLPNYRYGADYDVIEEGVAPVTQLDEITSMWATGKISLPSITDAVITHDLLHQILIKAGANLPFNYT